MREIKFRAWHKKQKKMFYILGFRPGHLLIEEDDRYRECDDWSPREEFILMQYTGFKDSKNEKEICEGDILHYWGINRASLREKKVNNVIAVKWELNGSWNIGGDWDYDGLSFFDLFTCEVIGNIYENPELLKPRAKEE